MIGTIQPKLFEFESDIGDQFSVPFDPHDKKYYSKCKDFNTTYRHALRHLLPEGVSVDLAKERDLFFNEDGNPMFKVVHLDHLRTEKGFYCDYFCFAN